MEERLRKEAETLLKEKRVDYIIGFAPGSIKHTTTPLITTDPSELQNLIINPFIVNNLTSYLAQIKGKVGIVVKGCDCRSLVSLLQDHKRERADLVILGIPCEGLIDLRKVEDLTFKERDEIDEIRKEKDEVIIKVDGKEETLPFQRVLFDKCLGCEYPNPSEYDTLLGEKVTPKARREDSRQKIAELEGKDSKERWGHWKKEFERCIRCYACRNICPACYCERCFVDINIPLWVLPAARFKDNLLFQLVRTLHVAGRCSDCGECERACPANIPLRLLQRRMQDLVKELFGFETGLDKESKALLTHYSLTDPEDFIR